MRSSRLVPVATRLDATLARVLLAPATMKLPVTGIGGRRAS
jgi:hypothetical protein